MRPALRNGTTSVRPSICQYLWPAAKAFWMHVCDARMQEFSVTLYLRQVWKDERLAFQSRGNRSVTLNHRQFDRMWTPDVFVRNLKAGVFHTITVPNRLIRLSPDGTILYSQRLTLTLACDMIFSNYPMDNQTCKIELGSCE